ncbi:hypothetical protein BDY19DRAFT_542529 [Irpex rosettiformis]|uniref:Uncharacterized protein n=1 Tax=Irpex rosettiformis TaxID=378272 RepID=A0ACB8TQK4_9APHY|nr:hypothetical protein BDY19DRAFT_542529 [Irpex rosettiformis]
MVLLQLVLRAMAGPIALLIGLVTVAPPSIKPQFQKFLGHHFNFPSFGVNGTTGSLMSISVVGQALRMADSKTSRSVVSSMYELWELMTSSSVAGSKSFTATEVHNTSLTEDIPRVEEALGTIVEDLVETHNDTSTDFNATDASDTQPSVTEERLLDTSYYHFYPRAPPVVGPRALILVDSGEVDHKSPAFNGWLIVLWSSPFVITIVFYAAHRLNIRSKKSNLDRTHSCRSTLSSQVVNSDQTRTISCTTYSPSGSASSRFESACAGSGSVDKGFTEDLSWSATLNVVSPDIILSAPKNGPSINDLDGYNSPPFPKDLAADRFLLVGCQVDPALNMDGRNNSRLIVLGRDTVFVGDNVLDFLISEYLSHSLDAVQTTEQVAELHANDALVSSNVQPVAVPDATTLPGSSSPIPLEPCQPESVNTLRYQVVDPSCPIDEGLREFASSALLGTPVKVVEEGVADGQEIVAVEQGGSDESAAGRRVALYAAPVLARNLQNAPAPLLGPVQTTNVTRTTSTPRSNFEPATPKRPPMRWHLLDREPTETHPFKFKSSPRKARKDE